MKDGNEKTHQALYFTYDGRGNVLKKELWGRLTGLPTPELVLNSSRYPINNGAESECHTYTYSEDGLNLVLTETDSSGKTNSYQYVKGTDRVQVKYVCYESKIQLREFYFYDDQYSLVLKITDNGNQGACEDLTGVTERHITRMNPKKTYPVGLPTETEESYLDLATGEERLLRSTTFTYSELGHLIKQEIFDDQRQFSHALEWEYDLHGNLIKETNALGEMTLRSYDANDNLISQQSSSSQYVMHNTYDFANRLIEQEEVHDDGQRFVTRHTYDYLGQCVATTNAYGQETQQTFDEFGRVIAIHHPPVSDENGQWVHPVSRKQYTIDGYLFCSTDPKGNNILTEYNIRGQPTKITHPDGTCEQWIYRIDGKTLQHVARNGLKTSYVLDVLGRITEESLLDLHGNVLKRTQHHYNSLHLLQTIDPEGKSTGYEYDGAGRIQRIHEGSRIQHYLYDSLGRQREMREWVGDLPNEYRSTIKKYDVLDRVIEERVESSEGKIFSQSRLSYDDRGNIRTKQVGDQITVKEYNTYNQVVKVTNSLGHSTHITYHPDFINSYGQHVLQTRSTDPLGYQIIDTYDAAQRIVETARFDPFGKRLTKQTLFYDLCGNQCRVQEEVIQEGTVQRVIETRYSYSPDNQVTVLIEAAGTPEQKITRTFYNAWGQKSSVIKPNGASLLYTYDALGRMQTLAASDGSLSYAYAYNLRDQVTKAIDQKTHLTTERAYDASGQMISETLGHGLSLRYEYDRIGRVRSIEFPDLTGVEYHYNAVHLKEIHRIKNGKRIYSHKDLEHTLLGQVTKTELAGNNGEVAYTYDGLGRCVGINNSNYQQNIPAGGFDDAGNLLKFESEGQEHHFTYDDYYHLKSEKGYASHDYTYDSVSNRIEKDGVIHEHNALNQVLKKGPEQFIYDDNGNLIRRMQHTEITDYAYDACDRLIKMTHNGKEIIYGYDAFHRRLTKKQGDNEEWYVYQGQEEIGRWQEGFAELRLLGKNRSIPMVAIELKEIPYVPLHDFSGNLVCLLNHDGRVIERYRYSAFGEREIGDAQGKELKVSSVGNPWQYASKRFDEETGLVAFGLRDYDPALGRWLTADPAGYADGSNLYAYVQNSPLIFFDEFGLNANALFDSVFHPAVRLITSLATKILFDCYTLFNYCMGGNPSEIVIKDVFIEDQLEKEIKFRKGSDYPVERTATYSLNEMINPETGQPYFKLKESLDIGIGFINGVANSLKDFCKSMLYLGSMSEFNIRGVYSASWGLLSDIKCYFNSLFRGAAYEGVQELQKMWYDFFANSSANSLFLQYAHSRGVVYVRNALLGMPEDIRNRIHVIAIAPGGYISPENCKKVEHFESSRDLVPLLDSGGRRHAKDTIVTLKPHASVGFGLDHNFTSPTYKNDIRVTLQNYNQR